MVLLQEKQEKKRGSEKKLEQKLSNNQGHNNATQTMDTNHIP
jgi:hypothetical protein